MSLQKARSGSYQTKTDIEQLLERSEGVRTEEIECLNGNREKCYRYEFYRTGDKVIPPDNVYIQVMKTATKGSIGRLVDIDYSEYPIGKISQYINAYILEFDDRPKTSRVSRYHGNIMVGYNGPTKWVRTVASKKDKPAIPPHVNKYNQTINIGNWVVGIGPSKKLFFGQVVRWSKASVFVAVNPEEPKKTNCISFPREAIVLPDADYGPMVTMMVLGGWTGAPK